MLKCLRKMSVPGSSLMMSAYSYSWWAFSVFGISLCCLCLSVLRYE